MPNQKYKEFLTKITTEDIINKMSEDKHVCPKSVGNVDLNTNLEEDAPTNSVAGGGVDMAPNARHPLSKSYNKYRKDNEKETEKRKKKIGQMVKENDDNNNNILKGVNQTLDLLESKIDEFCGIDNEIKFEEKKEYKTFSDKFGVGK
jgi:hypothetical protein